MRIALVTASFLPDSGGMEWVTHHLANTLVSEGIDATVLTRRQYERRERPGGAKYRLAYYGGSFRGSMRTGFDSWSLARMLSQGEKPDLVHVHGLDYSADAVFRWNRRWRIPVLGTAHGEDIQTDKSLGYGTRLNRGWDARIRRNIRRVVALTAISETIAQEYRGIVGAEIPIYAIPNGIDIQEESRAAPNPRPEDIRRKFGWSNDALVAVSIGRNHPKKGFAYAIKAVQAHLLRHPESRLKYLIVGKGCSELSPLLGGGEQAAAIRVEEQVEPRVLNGWLNQSNIFLIPSLVESFGIVTLEAMSCGLPCIGFNAPGTRDIVGPGMGYLVSTRDVDELSSAIDRYVTGVISFVAPEQLRDYARAFSWQNVGRMYIACYQEVISRSRFTKDRSVSA